MEMFHKTLDRVEAGDQAGILIKNVKRDEVKRGMVAVKAGTVQPTRGLLATVSYSNNAFAAVWNVQQITVTFCQFLTSFYIYVLIFYALVEVLMLLAMSNIAELNWTCH